MKTMTAPRRTRIPSTTKTMATPTMTPITTTAAATVSKTAVGEEMLYGFYPDRDNINIFSVRVPREAFPAIELDSISVKIENDQGYICAEERESHDLEIFLETSLQPLHERQTPDDS